MYKNARSSSTVKNNGSLSTPYAPRTSMARINTDYPGSLHRTMAWKKTYFSLSDPHLTHYFQNKLLASFDRESFSRPSSSLSTPRSKTSTATGEHKETASRRGRSHCDYKICVRTGPSNDAGTSARIYVTLRGSKGEVKRRRLTRGGKREFNFLPGSLERFRIQGKDVGELKQITVESEGLKLSEAWFVESITIINDEGKKWHCTCNQWLSLHHTDCQLARTLKAKPYQTKKPPEDDKALTCYAIEVHTGNVRGGGTCANVFVTLTGSKGTSSKTLIKADDGSGFDRGTVVTVKLECGDIGRLRSLTIEHDNSGFGPDWFLDRIVLYKSENPSKKAYFQCRQWLSRTEGDGAIQRVLQATSIAPPAEACVGKTYLVSTLTGSQRGAGTDANVFVTLYGSLGCSGEKRLDNHPANFERGRKDTFSIQCCDLGELTKVKVRHDNSGSGPSWLLDGIEVKWDGPEKEKARGGGGSGRGGSEAERVWHFPCGQWLEVCGGCGGKLEVELEVGGPSTEDSPLEKDKELFPYKVHVLTGTRPGAGTNANVYMILHGRDKHTGKIWLDNGQRSFLPGQNDEFEITTSVQVSPLESVTIGHDNSSPGPGWFLDKVKVTCLTSRSSWDFPCGRWLCMDNGDGRIERELHPSVDKSFSEKREKLGSWEVRVWTSDIRGAGTDANVTLQVHCKRSSSQPIPLGDSVANFEQGECDIFPGIRLPATVGDTIDSITLAHDNTNPYPDWHVDKVLLVNSTTGEEYLATCGKWLSADKGDCSTSINLKVVPQHSSKKTSDNRISQPVTPLVVQPGSTLTPPHTLPRLSYSQVSGNSNRKSSPTKTVTIISDPVQARTSLKDKDRLGKHPTTEEDGDNNERGVDNYYDEDEFESVSGSEESEVDIDGEKEERSDIEADRHVGLFSDTQELDSSITNEYLRHLRYEQLSSIDSSRAQNGSVTPQHALSPLGTSNKAISPAGTPLSQSKTIPYTIHVVAGAPPAIKPAPFLVVTLVSTRGHTNPIKLEPVESSDHSYSMESSMGTEMFSVEAADVGPITTIKVQLEGRSPSPPWLVNEINVYSPTSGHTHHFPWGRGIQPGRKLVIESADQLLGSSLNTSTLASSPRNGSTTSKLVAYEVQISTADKKAAGTNNNLHLILVGEKSSSKDFKMKNSSRDPKLQRGQTDTFNIAATSLLGSPKSIKIAHCPRHATTSQTEPKKSSSKSNNNSEVDEKWYLFQIVLVRLADRKKFYFLCRQWIMASDSRKNLKYINVPLSKTE